MVLGCSSTFMQPLLPLIDVGADGGHHKRGGTCPELGLTFVHPQSFGLSIPCAPIF
jgi:hypothetical protein